MRRSFAVLMMLPTLASATSNWPLWDAFVNRFVDNDGRVVDHHANERSTSEGQAYALFFALAAGDRAKFDRILGWTLNNLAQGDLTRSLPGWVWGEDKKSGKWMLLDHNSASDADLWLSYTLMEAGRLWGDPPLCDLGSAVARRISAEEVVNLRGFGPVLLPGRIGFQERPDAAVTNPSYLAPQVLIRLSLMQPDGPWEAILTSTPDLWNTCLVDGFVADWCNGEAGKGFVPARGPSGAPPKFSYDAIRVYLWAGMLPPDFPHRADFLNPLVGMVDYLRTSDFPPEEVSDSPVKPNGSVGFSGAVMPLLSTLGEVQPLLTQRRRLEQEFNAFSRLYGAQARYYDQCLLLFASGWGESRFRFDSGGELIVSWKQEQ